MYQVAALLQPAFRPPAARKPNPKVQRHRTAFRDVFPHYASRSAGPRFHPTCGPAAVPRGSVPRSRNYGFAAGVLAAVAASAALAAGVDGLRRLAFSERFVLAASVNSLTFAACSAVRTATTSASRCCSN